MDEIEKLTEDVTVDPWKVVFSVRRIEDKLGRLGWSVCVVLILQCVIIVKLLLG